MDSVFPFMMVCLLPLIWTALVFAAGRWSVRYRLRIEPQQTPYQQDHTNGYSEHYQDFEEV